MSTGSKGGRSYSDQSYGAVKNLTFGVVTAGTRATAVVDSITTQNPITVIGWEITNTTLGTGGSSQWVLASTSSSGTAALGTIIFVGTHAAGANLVGAAITEQNIPRGGRLDLYSVLSTAASLTVTAQVIYREWFVASDN